MGSSRNRSAFTLIELLVVVAIMGVLAALIFAAVASARQSALRVACSNNLRQLGIGLNGYYATKNGFPPDRLLIWDPVSQDDLPAGLPGKWSNCWTTLILPQLGLETIYQKYDLKKNWAAAPNDHGLNQIHVPQFECPAAPPSAVAMNHRGRNDYPACTEIGAGLFHTHGLKADPTFHGILGMNVSRRIDEITDGLSHTLLLAEDAGRNQEWRMGVDIGFVVEDGAWANPMGHIVVRGYDPATHTAPGPVAVNATNNMQVYGFHPNRAGALFGDGSVRFLPSSLSVDLLIAMTTRNAGDSTPGY